MTRPDFGPGAVHDERPDEGPDPRLEDECDHREEAEA